jgi:cell division septation protein DedD
VGSPIFISYASIDQDVAETICDALQARGHPCWIACRDIGPGENFQEAIVRAIRSARVMLLIFTSNANNSDEIKKEVVLAGRHRVTVLPVRVEDVVPNDAFAYEFATRQWIDLFKDWEREIDRLGAQIDTIVAAPKTGENEAIVAGPATQRKPARLPVAQKPSRGPLIAAALVIVAALGAGGFYLYTWAAPTPQPTAVANSSPAPATAPTAAPAPVVSSPPTAPSVATPQPAPAIHPAASASTGLFDGTWQTTITCPPAMGALALTLRLDAQVKDGIFHGQRGTEGQPGWLTLDGKIHPNGVAELYADGLVGAAAFAVGGAPRGSPYSYHANGKFSGSSGTGNRVEGRPCTIEFEKMAP